MIFKRQRTQTLSPLLLTVVVAVVTASYCAYIYTFVIISLHICPCCRPLSCITPSDGRAHSHSLKEPMAGGETSFVVILVAHLYTYAVSTTTTTPTPLSLSLLLFP